MSKTIQSDDEKRKAAYWADKKAKSDPSFYKRVMHEGKRLTEGRMFAKEVNQKKRK